MQARQGIDHAAPIVGARDIEAPAVEEFVRFCYHRRRVGWPELYDEMCAVAARGVFRGWGFAELADQGICFTLSDLPALAAVAAEVSREERERARRRTAATVVDATPPHDAGKPTVEGPSDGAEESIPIGAGLRPSGLTA
ncbi:MAG: hypothetical protein ABWY52_09580 [Candidatus Limnocylindrales bacterium]